MSKVFNMVGGGGGGGGGVTASISITGLSNTDTVMATKGSKTLTGKWTKIPNPAFLVLPDGYTQLEYIESTGEQYIATGTTFTELEMVMSWVDSSDTSTIVFGSNIKTYGFGCNKGKWFVSNGTAYAEGSAITNGKRYDVTFTKSPYLKITDNDSGAKLLDSSVRLGTNGDSNCIIFSDYMLGTPGKIRLYQCQIDNVRKFVPAKRNSDGAIGLYDLITSAFFENAGTGAFTAGPEATRNVDGFLISKIKDYGTWTVTATNGTKTATKDVLVDVITNYAIEMSLSA